MKSSLLVNTEIPFSNVDGPGNRYAIFLQGCNINCFYCHNPETINVCNNCQQCIQVCKPHALSVDEYDQIAFDQTKCVKCDCCIKICPNNSSPKTYLITPTDLANKILKYVDYIDGVTLSGGEPTLQFDAIVELVTILKEHKINVLVDTNLNFDLAKLQKLTDLIGGYMVDIKTTSEYEKFFGVNFEQNLVNLELLLKQSKIHEVRTVVFKDDSSLVTVKKVKQILHNYPEIEYKLIKMHNVHGKTNTELEQFLVDDEFYAKIKSL